jgi:hypothetical protein
MVGKIIQLDVGSLGFYLHVQKMCDASTVLSRRRNESVCSFFETPGEM